MGINLQSLLLLQQKGFLSSKNNILNIGPQNVYRTNENEIRQFLKNQGVIEINLGLSEQLKKINCYSKPRQEERTTTIISDITVLAGLEFCSFDICAAPYTEILDLNFDGCPEAYRNHFDVVLNSGTTERVLNQRNAFEVIHDATRVGGVIYCVLPMSGYLHRSFYCYTPLFFRYLAANNDYEMLDLFACPVGVNNIRELGLDVRPQTEANQSRPGVFLGEEHLLQFDIHAIMRKTSNLHFRMGMEVLTDRSVVDSSVKARYISNEYVTERQRLEVELAVMRGSTSWRITAPLRAIRRMLG